MRYFYDTEFLEAGPGRPLELISIGIVADDGRELYAVNADAPWDDVAAHAWLAANVLPHLTGPYLPRAELQAAVDAFLRPRPSQLWASHGAYDHVLLAQLFGTMSQLPAGVPMFTHDLQQLLGDRRVDQAAIPDLAGTAHHALDDARWLKAAVEFVDRTAPARPRPAPGRTTDEAGEPGEL